MIVRRKIDKNEVKELPKAAFPGRIYVIQSEAEIHDEGCHCHHDE